MTTRLKTAQAGYTQYTTEGRCANPYDKRTSPSNYYAFEVGVHFAFTGRTMPRDIYGPLKSPVVNNMRFVFDSHGTLIRTVL